MKILVWKKIKLATYIAIFALASNMLHAQQTVSNALLMAYKQMPETERPILIGVRINDSIESEVWNLQFSDPSTPDGRRLVVFTDGKFVSNQAGFIWPFGEGTCAGLEILDLNLSLSQLRKIATEQATLSGVKHVELTYVLVKPPDQPAQWDVYFLDAKKVILGKMSFSARELLLIKSEFKTPTAPPPTPPQPAQQAASHQPPAAAQSQTVQPVSATPQQPPAPAAAQ